jgi:WD40 repeat protein
MRDVSPVQHIRQQQLQSGHAQRIPAVLLVAFTHPLLRPPASCAHGPQCFRHGRASSTNGKDPSHLLFVAALGNNTVEVIDINEGKRIHTIPNLREPQGVLYLPDNNRLYVANRDDGTLRLFDGVSYEPLKTIKLGSDADNLRFDTEKKHVYVGYGAGALAAMTLMSFL